MLITIEDFAQSVVKTLPPVGKVSNFMAWCKQVALDKAEVQGSWLTPEEVDLIAMRAAGIACSLRNDDSFKSNQVKYI